MGVKAGGDLVSEANAKRLQYATVAFATAVVTASAAAAVAAAAVVR